MRINSYGLVLAALMASGMMLPGAAAAKQVIYICRLDVHSTQNWVPELAIFSEDDETGKVTVFDTLIKYFMGNPIEARVLKSNGARLSVNWKLKRLKNVEPKSLPPFVYTANIARPGLDITIRAVPHSYDNYFSAQGRCRIGEK